jgi:ATP-dependent helicase/DNAse subunit B
MPLTLVTGPANAGKAGELLRAYRSRLADDPVLVVPRSEDVEHTRRELAYGGAVLGPRVVRFGGLVTLIAERADPALAATPRVSGLCRELLVAEAVRRTTLRTVAEAARRPGFARAAGRFAGELGRAMIDPGRLRSALCEWAGDGGRRAYAEDLADLYGAYRAVLEEAGAVDDELLARGALDALRRDPRAFGRSPVFVYGFDDFTPVELDAIETLARHADVEVTVSLPFEPGRTAFRATAPAFALLSELADERRELPPSAEHYAPEGRPELARLERELFDPAPAANERPSPAAALKLHLAGGERCELELAGAEVLQALRHGAAPGDVTVVVRDPPRYSLLLEEVFGALGIPFSLVSDRFLAHTALGRGVVALLRCAAGEGSADDLVAYLRTPGVLRSPGLADELEREGRRSGTQSAAEACALWERRRWPLEELDVLGSARGTDLLGLLDRRLERLLSASPARRASLFCGPKQEDAAAVRAARGALADLAGLAARDLAPPLDAAALGALLGEVPVRVGEPPSPERVRVASPEDVRARRFDTVVVLGLEDGEFPRRPVPEPFLSDELRREVSEASGLSLPVREDELDRERYLFYACVSRAERRLVLSTRVSDEEGAPARPSSFLEEVRALFAPDPLEAVTVRRSLGDVTWEPGDAPTPLERVRSLAARGPRVDEAPPRDLWAAAVLAEVCERRAFSTGELDALGACGVRWLVEKVVRPEGIAPEGDPLVRGRYAHDVLRLTFERLRERTGSARVTRATLLEAERFLGEAMTELAPAHRLAAGDGRARAARRRLEDDLVRLLRREAEAGSQFEATHLELAFGGTYADEGSLPALAVDEGIEVRGRIDRVDTLGGRAAVRDYKGGADAPGVARWADEGRLQVAVYMLAVRELLGLEVAAGLYVPLAGGHGQRGAVRRDEADAVAAGTPRTDLRTDAEIDALMTDARARVVELVSRLRAGELRPCPERCGPDGRCRYPGVCRLEAA